MWYSSKIIAHTASPDNLDNQIITWEIVVPKWLVGEVNTHKVEIERNSASSRAVPTKIILDMVRNEPVLPVYWRANDRGMVSKDVSAWDGYDEWSVSCQRLWLKGRDAILDIAEEMLQLKPQPAKELINRMLEPWMWTTIVLTMTTGGKIGLNNFFGLRDTLEAQPEFKEVAHSMHEQYHMSKPSIHKWHLPYVDWDEIISLGNGYWTIKGEDFIEADITDLYRMLALRSSARCGRVTHYKQGQEYTLAEDIDRGQKFATNGHYSPLRHAAQAGNDEWYGNMYGWIPISKIIMDGQDYVTQCCDRASIVA